MTIFGGERLGLALLWQNERGWDSLSA